MESTPVNLRKTDLLEIFKREAEALSAQVIIAEGIDMLVREINSLCRERDITRLPHNLLATADWRNIEAGLTNAGLVLINETSREVLENNRAALNVVNYGIADTGTLVFFETSADDVRPGTIPSTHIAILKSNDIHMYATSISNEINNFIQGSLAKKKPCRVSMVSGPSRTADIERELTVGVHGPKELVIFILDESSEN